MNTVTLSQKNQALYRTTYQTMLDRLQENGYAQTSLTGAYRGMFVRDASIQAMAHLANGDLDKAERILRYMTAYHMAIGDEFAVHIMDTLAPTTLYDYIDGKIVKGEAGTSTGSAISQKDVSRALYKVVLPGNSAAQKFTVPCKTITDIRVYLQITANSGTVHLSVGNQPEDASLATADYTITKTETGWINFHFDEPITVVPGTTYCFTVGAECDGNVVAFGKAGGSPYSYNYDKAAFGGWREEKHALGFEICSDESIDGEENAITQTFRVRGDRIDRITVSLTCNRRTTVTAILKDADDKEISRLRVPCQSNGMLDLDFGAKVTEGETYSLTLWADDGSTVWVIADGSYTAYRTADPAKTPLNASYTMEISPEYSGSLTSYRAIAGGSTVVSQALSDACTSGPVTHVWLYLSANGTPGANDTFTVTLKKGDVVVDTLTRAVSTLDAQATLQHFSFCLPISETEDDEPYTVELSASRDNSVAWHGRKAGDLSWRAGLSVVKPYSRKIQVDGNYMLVNAYAMYAIAAGKSDELVHLAYPLMKQYALYFMENGYLHDNGLVRNPNYEHSRDGRYWDAYDLITNCFASEAFHKMAAVAEMLGNSDDQEVFNGYADDIADAVHSELTCDFHGKTIYTELIALDEDGKVYKGFSFVSLAPVAADWYAMDEEIMANTYEMYLQYGSEMYGKHRMLTVVAKLNDNDTTISRGNHVIGKGLAWELYYLWKTGNTERLNDMLAFVEERSRETYPETWINTGALADSANQEQASWMLYEVARISGICKN